MGAPTTRSINIHGKPASGDSDNNLLRKIDGILATGAGLGGNDIVADTNTRNGTWGVIHALTDVTFTTVTFAPGDSSGTLAGKTLLAGDRIYGDIRTVKLFVGSAILYRSAVL
jgi:hypothetical protein